MELKEKELSRLMVPVHKLPDNKSAAKYFSQFKNNPIFQGPIGPIDKNKAIKYIVYMYDYNSPFRRKIDDANERKIECAKYAGFGIDGNFNSEVKGMLSGGNGRVNQMIIEYIRMHRRPKYSYLVAVDKQYYDSLEKVMIGGEDAEDAGKLMGKLQKEYEQTMNDLLSEDNNQDVRNQLFDVMERERLDKFRPEGIAQEIASGRDPIPEGEIYGN